MVIKDAEAFAIYGRRKSGKSHLTKKLIKNHKRILVFDPMNEYGKLRGWKSVFSVDEMHEVACAKWNTGFKIAFNVDKNYQEELHRMSAVIWTMQKAATRKILIVVEEMNLGYPPNVKDAYFGFPKLVMQGRHRGVEIIGITQRPNAVNRNFRSNCAASYFFPLEDEEDIKIIQRKVGKENLSKYRNMRKHFHMKTENGSVEFRKA